MRAKIHVNGICGDVLGRPSQTKRVAEYRHVLDDSKDPLEYPSMQIHVQSGGRAEVLI